MNNIYQHYIIDLSSNNNFVQIPAMQGDGNSIRGFEIELVQNGLPYVADREDTLVSIMGTKPDTSQIMNPCTLTEEGYILVDITSQMTAVKGRGDYQIVLFGRSANSQLKSFPFHILTTPAAFDIDAVISSDEFQTLSRNITRTESAIGGADQAVSDVRALEASVEAEEASRVKAEEARVLAEGRREEAEAARGAGENAREEKEAARQAAEAERAADEASRAGAEAARESNEEGRSAGEEARRENEAAREEAEAEREASEAARTGAEAGREAAETAREEAEALRNASEAERAAAENVRGENEIIRQENETARRENEAARQEKLSEAVSDAQGAADRAASSARAAAGSAESAQEAESEAALSALKAESWARGGTGTREGEDTDNADFYYRQSRALHDDILAAGEASEENAGLMSARDKSWLDGKFRRYIYGSDLSGEDKKGYYKIASVESDVPNHTYALRLLIWSPIHADYPVPPAEAAICFQTGSAGVSDTRVTAYGDLSSVCSRIFRNICVKYPDDTSPGRCEIYFDRTADFAKVAVDVLGECIRNPASSEEKYQKVWTFYDNFTVSDSVEEEGYVFKSLIECMNGPTVGSDTTPIYMDRGIPKPCANLPDPGTSDYNDLNNKPYINGVEIAGHKSVDDLKIPLASSNVDMGIDTPFNAIGYVLNSDQIYGVHDGAMFVQKYSDSRAQQIYGDYRTGQIATRGKDNGTWGAWRRQLDDQNYTRLATAFRPQFHFYSTEERTTGYTKVRINPDNHWMISLNVQLYQNYVAHEMLICGYSYGDHHWHLPKASLTSTTDASTMDVIFGYDADNYLWFAIAAGNYTGLTVCDINNGYQQKDDWSNAVTIEYVPTLTGTTQTTVRTYAPTRSQTIKRIEKVSSLPSDAASHTDTLYVIA